jgi:hypothetical protein
MGQPNLFILSMADCNADTGASISSYVNHNQHNNWIIRHGEDQVDVYC